MMGVTSTVFQRPASGSLVRVDKGLARDAVAARQAMERRITDAAPRAGDWLQAGF